MRTTATLTCVLVTPSPLPGGAMHDVAAVPAPAACPATVASAPPLLAPPRRPGVVAAPSGTDVTAVGAPLLLAVSVRGSPFGPAVDEAAEVVVPPTSGPLLPGTSNQA